MSLDTLSDVLRGVRLRGAVFFDISGNSDWVAEAPPASELAPLLMPGVEHGIDYHAVAQGSCWAGIPGGAAVQLFAGDVIMFPHGDAHVVSSAPGMRGNADLSWRKAQAGSPACAIVSSAVRWRCCTSSRRRTGPSTNRGGASACRARPCTSASCS